MKETLIAKIKEFISSCEIKAKECFKVIEEVKMDMIINFQDYEKEESDD